MPQQTCLNCRHSELGFFQRSPFSMAQPDRKSTYGHGSLECHRHAPFVDLRITTEYRPESANARWPVVTSDDWCSEWAAE